MAETQNNWKGLRPKWIPSWVSVTFVAFVVFIGAMMFYGESSYVKSNNYTQQINQLKNEIKEKAEQMVKEMKERHQKELDEYKELFESNWPKNNPTSTKEMLEIEKKMNVVISKKQFMSAQQYQDKLNDLKEKNDLKWNTEIKEKKLNAEIKKLTTKQNNELNALYQKINSINNEFDAKQNKDIAIIEKKYNNKERDYLNEAKRKTDQIILSSRKVIHKNEYN